MALLKSSRILPNVLRQCSRVVQFQTQQFRGAAQMAFTFASSVNVFYKDAPVKQVDVPSFSGSFGILPEHVPLLAVLKPGLVTVTEEDGSAKKYVVSSGSITINDDSSVQILAEEAFTADELDAQAIREGANKASQDLMSATTDQAKAEAEIAVECYEALQKAIE